MKTTETAKHAPGSYYYDTESDHRYIRQESSDRVIAHVDDNAYPDKSHAWAEEQIEAHGHLLASAPDLWKELGGIATNLEEGQTVTIQPGSVKAASILAAIAKAEGRA